MVNQYRKQTGCPVCLRSAPAPLLLLITETYISLDPLPIAFGRCGQYGAWWTLGGRTGDSLVLYFLSPLLHLNGACISPWPHSCHTAPPHGPSSPQSQEGLVCAVATHPCSCCLMGPGVFLVPAVAHFCPLISKFPVLHPSIQRPRGLSVFPDRPQLSPYAF